MSNDRPPADADDPNVLSYQSPAEPGRRWVNVWKPRNTMEANLAVATLQEHGIHARVDMENSADLGLLYTALLNCKVQVLAHDEQAARKLLLEIDQLRAQRQEAMTLKCPSCGTPNPKHVLHPLRWAAWVVLIGFVALFGFIMQTPIDKLFPRGLPLLLLPVGLLMLVWGVTPRWRCRSCGYRWYAREPEELDEDDDQPDEPPEDNDDDDTDGDDGESAAEEDDDRAAGARP